MIETVCPLVESDFRFERCLESIEKNSKASEESLKCKSKTKLESKGRNRMGVWSTTERVWQDQGSAESVETQNKSL